MVRFDRRLDPLPSGEDVLATPFGPTLKSRPRFSCAGLVAALATLAPAQALPDTVTFFVLPDGNLAPGSESMLVGAATPPSGPSIPFAFDFTEDQRIDRNGYVVLHRTPGAPQALVVVDFLLRATDRDRGVTLTLSPASQPCGTWTTSDPQGTFPPGSQIAGSLDCVVAVDDPALAALFPATATLTLGGSPVPGYYHQVTLFAASLAGLPATSFNLFLKEDLHVADITWVSTALPGAATALRVGATAPDALRGGFGLRRNPATWVDYELTSFSLAVDGAPALAITGAGPNGSAGFVTLHPETRTATGFLDLVVDGVPVQRVLDGVGDVFTGSPTMPTSLTLREAGLGGLACLDFVGGKPGILPKSNDFQIGALTELRVLGRPGDLYFTACSFQPVPGVNTPIGDVLVSLDAMFWFSLDPANGFIGGNVGMIAPTGEGSIFVSLPNAPWLIGYTTFFAGILMTNEPALGGFVFSAVTNPHRAIIR